MWITAERRAARVWAMPVTTVIVGIAIAGFEGFRGHLAPGLWALAVLAGYAVLLAYRRGEDVLVLHEAFGVGRRGRVHMRAAAMTGDVLAAGLVCAVIAQVLHGHTLGWYGWLAALGGVTYALSAAFSVSRS
jgi:hypothetical protein